MYNLYIYILTDTIYLPIYTHIYIYIRCKLYPPGCHLSKTCPCLAAWLAASRPRRNGAERSSWNCHWWGLSSRHGAMGPEAKHEANSTKTRGKNSEFMKGFNHQTRLFLGEVHGIWETRINSIPASEPTVTNEMLYIYIITIYNH